MRVVWPVLDRIQACADQGPALADELQQSKAASLPALVGLVVDAPGDDEGDDVEEPRGGRVDGHVAEHGGELHGLGDGEDGVPGGRSSSVENDGDGPSAEAVGEVGGDEDEEKGDEERGRAEGLGGEVVEAHLGEDLGEEDGEGGVGHVGEEEHGGGDPGDGVAEDGEEGLALNAGRVFLLVGLGGGRLLAAEAQPGDFTLALGEVRYGLRGVGNDSEGDDAGYD